MINNNHDVRSEQKKLIKSSFYSFMTNYGTQIFSLITSFFIARLITQELWGILILATSFISIAGIILSFLPPGLDFSIHYYISVYSALNQNSKIKKLIKNSIILRVISSIPIYLITNLIIIIFLNFFNFKLNNYSIILFVLAPMILINGIDSILISINKGFNKFKTIFLLLVIKYTFNIGILLFCFLLFTEISIEFLALINILSLFIPFLINIFIISFTVLKLKDTNENVDSLSEDFKKSFKYGGPITLGASLLNIWKQIEIQGISFFETPQIIVGYNIATHYTFVPKTAISSVSSPLITTFSNLNVRDNYEQIQKIYVVFFKYSLFLLLIFTGFLFFLVDFFLAFIYGESYLIYSWILKLSLLIVIFRPLGGQFTSYIHATNKVKYIPIMNIVSISVLGVIFFIGLAYYGIYGAIIGSLIAYVILFTLQLFLSKKITQISLDIKNVILQYIIFFVSLIVSIVLDFLILKEVNHNLVRFLNLNIFNFEYFQFLPMIVFLSIFLILVLITKVFSVKDIDYIYNFLNKDKKTHYFIAKSLRILKKLIKE